MNENKTTRAGVVSGLGSTDEILEQQKHALRNIFKTRAIVTDPTDSFYNVYPNPPKGSTFNSLNGLTGALRKGEVSSNGSCWAIIAAHKYYMEIPADWEQKAKLLAITKDCADFMCDNLSVGRFNSMNFEFVDINYKYDGYGWTKSDYKEIYLSTMFLQVKALVCAYQIHRDERYLETAYKVLDSLYNVQMYIKRKVSTQELPSQSYGAVYEYLACDNLASRNSFVGSTRILPIGMGYYIAQAIDAIIEVVGDVERSTPKGDNYKPSDIKTEYAKFLSNMIGTGNLTAYPTGLPYGHYYRAEDGSYKLGNWNFIDGTYGDEWFVGDVVCYTIIGLAALGFTTEAKQYLTAYYNLRVPVTNYEWSNRFNADDLVFYDRIDFGTGSHLPDDSSISITYTSLFMEMCVLTGTNSYVQKCAKTLLNWQSVSSIPEIDGAYPWDVSVPNASIELKSYGEIVNSEFFKYITTTTPTIIPVASVSLNKNSTTLAVGQTETLAATVSPANATNKTVSWSSNNQSVATVSNGVITAKTQGSATITVTTSDGNKTASCVVTVNQEQTTPPTTNNAPTITAVLVSNETTSGSYTLSYAANDSDGDTLTHKLKIDNGSYSTINPVKSGTSYTYNGSGLSVGSHTGQIQVSDGKISTTSTVFNITIRQQATGVKAELKQAKDIYDEKHTALKTTINNIISDGEFDEATEKSQLDRAFAAYNTALANFKKMCQKAIDFISDAKKDEAIDESKVYTNAQIKVVNDSITQRVERVEEKQTTVDGKVTSLETWKQEAQQKITADAIINTVSSTITQAKNEAIDEANANTTNALKNYPTTTQMNSAIQQKADSITSIVSSTVNQAKQEAITSANKSTDDKLQSYSTTTQMNSVIQQKADSINATVSANYTDLNGKIQSANTAITQTANKIASKVDSNGVKSIIEQSSDSVKVGFNGITNAIVMSQTGIRMNSNAGAYTQFSSNGMSSFNNSSQQTLGIKNGGITFHPWNGTQLGAYITQSALHSGTASANGLAISTANNGAYLSFGTSSMSDANSTLNMDQALTISSNDNFQPKGINFWKDVHAHGCGIRQLAHLQLAGSGAIQFDYLNTSPSTIYEAVNNGHSLYVMGGYQMHLGCMDGKGVPKGVIWMQNSTNTHSYTHWDFHNYTMYNMKTASTYANYDTRRIGESYGVTSNVDGVRYLYKNVELVNGKAIRSIPLEYKGCKYDIVSIVCKGRGSAWVETEGENRFEVNGDCKSVNIEIIIYPSEAVMTASTQQLEEAPTLELPKKTEPEEALIITNEAV